MSWREAHAAQLRGEAKTRGGLATMRWFNSDGEPPPAPKLLQQVLDTEQRSAEGYRGVLGSMLLLDVALGEEYAPLLAAGQSGDSELRRLLVALLRALFRGPALESPPLDDVRRLAQESQEPDLRIHATTLASLTLLRDGNIAEGLSLARRASRMARAEQLPHEEFFAALTLARARRYDGTHHLALRILSALHRVCMPIWRGWLDWELAMVGAESTGNAVGGLAYAAHEFRASLARGAPPREGPSIFEGEASSAFAAVHPHVDVPNAIAAWSRGEVHDLPPGLSGISTSEDDTTWVFAGPGVSARRFLALRSPSNFGDNLHSGKVGRVHEALCILLLAGAGGMEKETFFRTTYGFDYVPALHKATFKVLRHRMRQQLGPVGALNVEGERLTIELHKACVVPDPRSGHSLADRVLRVLSRQKAGSAKSASAALNVPLRSIQATLKELVENGECVPTRDGRNQNYRVEDTTFSDPSLRLRRELLT